MNILKEVLKGIYTVGFLRLFRTIVEHWIIVVLVIAAVVLLCSCEKTDKYTWIFICVFALYTAIKAVWDFCFYIGKYLQDKKLYDEEKCLEDLGMIGGSIFDFILSAVGFLQSVKILSHIARLSHSVASSLGVVDDSTSAIANIIKRFVGTK